MRKRGAVASAYHESIHPTMGGASMAGFALARMHVKPIYEAVWIRGMYKRLASAAARLCDSIGYQGGMSASLRGGVVPERVENGRAAEQAGPLDGNVRVAKQAGCS